MFKRTTKKSNEKEETGMLKKVLKIGAAVLAGFATAKVIDAVTSKKEEAEEVEGEYEEFEDLESTEETEEAE